jgi:hypothetical protein
VTWAGMVHNALTAATTSSGQPRATTCCSSARSTTEPGGSVRETALTAPRAPAASRRRKDNRPIRVSAGPGAVRALPRR